MDDLGFVLLVVGVVGLLTFGLRALPFWLPAGFFERPTVRHVAGSMPLVVMVLLVLDSLWGSHRDSLEPLGMMAGVLASMGLHLGFRQPLLSITGGVGVFMLALMMLG